MATSSVALLPKIQKTIYRHNSLLRPRRGGRGTTPAQAGKTYDGRGRITGQSAGTRSITTTYDSAGNVASVTDPRNLTTSFDYDAVGRRTAIHRPDNSAVRFTYDKMGNMTVLTTPANVPHDFEYNAVNRNSAYDTPLSGSYVYSYDRDRRLTKISFPSGKSITRAYQDAQLASVTMPEGRVNYTYEPCGSTVTRDAAGNIATRTETVAGESHEYAYAYDNVGRLTQVTKDAAVVESYSYDGPHNARTAETNTLRGLTNRAYAYDDEDHLTSAGDASFTYDKDGFLTG